MEHYSDPMIKNLREATAVSKKSHSPTVELISLRCRAENTLKIDRPQQKESEMIFLCMPHPASNQMFRRETAGLL